jgi:hypothetical protein
VSQGSKKVIGRPFAKGQAANPAGRPKGIPDRRTKYRELIEPHIPSLIEKCVALALRGDMQALRICLDKVIPSARDSEEAIAVPACDSSRPSDQARAVVEAAMSAKITPSSAATLISAIAGQARVIELDDLARRLDVLESRLSEQH